MQIPVAAPAQSSRSERPILDNLHLHPAAHRLRDPVRAPQTLHLEGVLGGAPGEEARFEGVRGRRRSLGLGGGGRARRRGRGEVVAQRVRQARGRRGAF